MNYILLLASLFAFPFSAFGQSSLETFLKSQKITFNKIPCQDEFTACYEIYLPQQVDPQKPEKGYFSQKLFLSHRDAGAPLVLFISGYEARRNIIKDWTTHYKANQIFVEHRYFGSSRPDSIDYITLSIENAAHDLHHIREIFGKFYRRKWLSTGGSKGGLTAAAYKYFYPQDVAATILHSTSVKDKACDSSFFNYTDSLSRKYGCLEKIFRFQRTVLEKRDSILPRLKAFLDEQKQPYEKLGLDTILELAVLEFPFSIWQNNAGCWSLPELNSSPDSLFSLLRMGVDNWFHTDAEKEMEPFAYQAYKELGYYCYKTEALQDLLRATPQPATPYFRPPAYISYSNSLMVKMRNWLTTKGNHIIYINGTFDPYSRYLIQPSRSTNSVLFLLAEKNHLQANYANLSDKQQIQIDRLIRGWLRKD